MNHDAIVIGAGPAGALTGLLLAQAGLRTLLVDRKAFPRGKVCGGCLNPRALASLDRHGLLERVRRRGGTPVRALDLHHRFRHATIGLPPGLAISRHALDDVLVHAARDAGAETLSETTAAVVEDTYPTRDASPRLVRLKRPNGSEDVVSTLAVVVADGLGHSSLRECPEMQTKVASHARIGVGALLPRAAFPAAPATITMAIGRRGYVGAVAVEDGRMTVAAALDPDSLREHGTIAAAATQVLREAGISPATEFSDAQWSGTLPLTRRMMTPAGRRLFVVGDAAGYVEPFTGEGMAWALAGAEQVTPYVRAAAAAWDVNLIRAWGNTHARLVGRDQRWCRAISRTLRSPGATAAAIALLHRFPRLAGPVLMHLSAAGPSWQD